MSSRGWPTPGGQRRKWKPIPQWEVSGIQQRIKKSEIQEISSRLFLPLMSNTWIFLAVLFNPPSPSGQEALGSLHWLDSCALEWETDAVRLCFCLVRNISKFNYKRPPNKTKSLQCAEYNGNLRLQQSRLWLSRQRNLAEDSQSMKGILHKTKVSTQWHIFQAHEQIGGSNTKETWFSYRTGAGKGRSPISSCNCGRETDLVLLRERG